MPEQYRRHDVVRARRYDQGGGRSEGVLLSEQGFSRCCDVHDPLSERQNDPAEHVTTGVEDLA